jgi:small subunit ribosomal protein S8
MKATDSIADMLTRIRNASSVGLKYANIPASGIKISMTQILEKEGMIAGYRLIKDEQQGMIKIALKYDLKGRAVLRGAERVSNSSNRVYSGYAHLPTVRAGLGFAILSTPKGLMTDREAREGRVGGEILAYIW